MNRTYDMEMLQLLAAFEKLTHTRVKDVLVFKEMPTFIVEEGELNKAVGPRGQNIERVERMLGKKVKIAEFRKDPCQFLESLLHPYRTAGISMDGSVIVIQGTDMKTNGLIIGARAQNLRAYEEIVKRYFPEITEIKVVS
jgi:NusA-like KH domain protein